MGTFEQLKKTSEALGFSVAIHQGNLIRKINSSMPGGREESEELSGCYWSDSQEIMIIQDNEEVMTESLAHELGHALLQSHFKSHFKSRGKDSYDEAFLVYEIEAEAFAHDITEFLGVKISLPNMALLIRAVIQMSMEEGRLVKATEFEPALIHIFSRNFRVFGTEHLREDSQPRARFAKNLLKEALEIQSLSETKRAIATLSLRRKLENLKMTHCKVWTKKIQEFMEKPISEEMKTLENDHLIIGKAPMGDNVSIFMNKKWLDWMHSFERPWTQEMKNDLFEAEREGRAVCMDLSLEEEFYFERIVNSKKFSTWEVVV